MNIYLNFTKTYFNSFIIILIFFITLSSCKILKNNFSSKSTELTKEQFIDSIQKNNLQFTSLYFKFDAKIESSSQNLSFSGNMKIRKDSAILISIAPLGFEVGRALFSKDSITILNKVQNEFFYDDYDYFLIKRDIFMNYEIIESLFTDAFFYYSENVTNYKNVSFTENDTVFILDDIYSNDLLTYNQKTYVDNKTFNIEKTEINQINTNNYIIVEYSNFIDVGTSKFPSEIKVVLKKNNVSYLIVFEISKILLNKELKFNIEIPENYERVWY